MTLLPETEDYVSGPAFAWRRWLPLAGVVIALLGATMLGVSATCDWEAREEQDRFTTLAEGALPSVQAGLEVPVAMLRSSALRWEATGAAGEPAFRTMAKALESQAAGVEAVAWALCVADAGRAAFEAEGRAAGLPGFRITEKTSGGASLGAPCRDEHYPVRLFDPGQGHEAVLGLDLGADPDVREAFARARRTGQPVATGPLSLLLEGDAHPRFLVIQAVGCGAPTEGFLVAIVRTADLLETAAGSLKGRNLVLRITDEAMPQGKQFLCQLTASRSDAPIQMVEREPASGRSAPSYAGVLQVAGRRWNVVCTPGPGATAATAWVSRAVGTGGLLATALLAAGYVGLVTRRGRAARLALQLKETQRRLEESTSLDELTRVSTRRRILDRLKVELERAGRRDAHLAVALFHVDHLREVNDTLGHGTGDRALAEVAKLIRGRLRPKDGLGRHAADEFLVLMPETPIPEAAALAEAIRKALAQRRLASARAALPITVSVGVASTGQAGADTVDRLVGEADRALEAAKASGRNCTRTSGEVPASCRRLIDQDPGIAALSRAMERLAGQAKDAFVASLQGMLEAIDARDPFARHHAANTTRYAVGAARVLGLGEDETGMVRRAAMLHDIGNIAVPPAILQKTGVLTAEERRLMEQHVMIGIGLLEPTNFLEHEVAIIRQHHERWDGHGYPDGIQRAAIPLEARILAVADAFDAITSDRSYRKARDAGEAIEILLEESEHQFDPEVVDALICWVRSKEDGAIGAACAVAAAGAARGTT